MEAENPDEDAESIGVMTLNFLYSKTMRNVYPSQIFKKINLAIKIKVECEL